MTTRTYTLTVTENHAMLLAQACELVARIQMGQWHEFIDWLPPTKKFCRHSLREQIQTIMSEHFRKTKPDGCPYAIDGWGSHYGIHSEYIPDTARVAWDLQKVIQHRLAWDRNPEGGFTVDFVGPHRVGGEPLAIMKRVESSQWIKCSERLPDLGRLVLVCDKPAGTVKAAALYEFDDDDGLAYGWIVEAPSGDPEGFDFEYWMPLPLPPEIQPHEAQRG